MIEEDHKVIADDEEKKEANPFSLSFWTGKAKECLQKRHALSQRREFSLFQNNLESNQKTIDAFKIFLSAFEENPDISYIDLKQRFNLLKLTERDEKVFLAIYKELKLKRERSQALYKRFIRAATQKLESQSFSSQEDKLDRIRAVAGEDLFLFVSGRKPKGTVNILDTPLAIGVELTDFRSTEHQNKEDDISSIRNGKPPAGGHFAENSDISLSYIAIHGLGSLRYLNLTLRTILGFSFIFTDLESREAKPHEVQHSINSAIKRGLNKERLIQKTWGGNTSYEKYRTENSLPLRIKKLALQYDQGKITKHELKNKLLIIYETSKTLPLARAKEEIVADFSAKIKVGTNYNFFYHINYLKADLGKMPDGSKRLYSFLEYLGFDETTLDSEKKDILIHIFSMFNNTLEASVELLDEFCNLSAELSHTHNLKQVLYFLIAFPLETWAHKAKELFGPQLEQLRSEKNEKSAKETLRKNIASLTLDMNSSLGRSDFAQRVVSFPGLSTQYYNLVGEKNSLPTLEEEEEEEGNDLTNAKVKQNKPKELEPKIQNIIIKANLLRDELETAEKKYYNELSVYKFLRERHLKLLNLSEGISKLLLTLSQKEETLLNAAKENLSNNTISAYEFHFLKNAFLNFFSAQVKDSRMLKVSAIQSWEGRVKKTEESDRAEKIMNTFITGATPFFNSTRLLRRNLTTMIDDFRLKTHSAAEDIESHFSGTDDIDVKPFYEKIKLLQSALSGVSVDTSEFITNFENLLSLVELELEEKKIAVEGVEIPDLSTTTLTD